MTAPTPPSLLDPASVTALLGDGWTFFDDPDPDEYTWQREPEVDDQINEIGLYHGELWIDGRGIPVEITSAQQVADLLAAKGIELVPVELTSAYAAGRRSAAEEISERCLERSAAFHARYEAYPNAHDRGQTDAMELASDIALEAITATREESRS
jgi:hypothetical protein